MRESDLMGAMLECDGSLTNGKDSLERMSSMTDDPPDVTLTIVWLVSLRSKQHR